MTKENSQENDIEISNITLLKAPLKTLYGFFNEVIFRSVQFAFAAATYKKTCVLFASLYCIFTALSFKEGPHTEGLNSLKKTLLWWFWWVWLGFLSSCGFGTGLHTFVLYLGPFIASVTMGAYECGSLNFPEPPFPDRVICPDSEDPRSVTLINIIRKVQIPSILWGLGTAIGELPPYFMARGARLSGRSINKSGNEELEELAFILETEEKSSMEKEKNESNSKEKNSNHSVSSSSSTVSTDKLPLMKRAELLLHRMIKKAGFFGILLCASVPNPLFDLAGMTCGHFLVPFWSFFGATFIGKAIIKVHIQQLTIIALSSEDHVEWLVDLIGLIPVYGARLEEPFLRYLNEQRDKIHNKVTDESSSMLKLAIQYTVLSMILLFVISIINAAAQSYYRRMQKWRAAGDIEVKLTKQD